jgi:hypothetical protein
VPKSIRPYMDFSGGLNTDKSPDHLADNELAAADNVVLELRGALSSRKGCRAINGESFNGTATQVFEWMRTTGDVRLMSVIDKQLCLISDGVPAAIQTVDSSRVAQTAFQDRLYFIDGAEVYVYDGTTCEAVTPSQEAGMDIAPIRKCKFLLWDPRSYRFFAAGNSDDPGALYYSEPNDPTAWKNTSKLYPSRAEGAVTALALFAHAMVVFFADGLWLWKGIDPEADAVWQKVPVPYGTLAPESIELTPNSLTWLANGAIVSMSPAVLDYNLTLLPGTDLVANISVEKVGALVQGVYHPETACGVYDVERARYMLAYGDDPNNSNNNRVLAYSWPLRGFTRFTGWMVHDWCFRRSNRQLVFASDNYLLATEAGYSDVDCKTGGAVPIDIQIETKRFNLDLPFFVKRNFKLFIAGQNAGGHPPAADVKVRSIGPKGKTVYIPHVTFNDGTKWGDLWGGKWPYDDAMTVECKAKCQGERFQVLIHLANLGESLNLYGVAFEFRPKAKPKGVRHVGKTD